MGPSYDGITRRALKDVSTMVETYFVEIGYLEFHAMSHSNYFPLNTLFSDFLSANPKPDISNYAS